MRQGPQRLRGHKPACWLFADGTTAPESHGSSDGANPGQAPAPQLSCACVPRGLGPPCGPGEVPAIESHFGRQAEAGGREVPRARAPICKGRCRQRCHTDTHVAHQSLVTWSYLAARKLRNSLSPGDITPAETKSP